MVLGNRNNSANSDLAFWNTKFCPRVEPPGLRGLSQGFAMESLLFTWAFPEELSS